LKLKIGGFVARPFFIVSARSQKNLEIKIGELQKMDVPFIVVCGEKLDHPNVVYRKINGKWDAINYASAFVPEETNVIVLNDADTQIHNFKNALISLNKSNNLVYCRVKVPKGPQLKFYKLLNPIRKICQIAASGELMIMNREVFSDVLPLPACLAEDSYILFKALELGYRASFSERTYVTTERTSNSKQEEAYKHRTTLGIYQALDHSRPPLLIRVFYLALPLFAPMLSLAGKDGRAWSKGINKAVKDHFTKKNPTKF
jgi:hypothetical protein